MRTRRLLLALATGLIATVTSLLAAWLEYRNSFCSFYDRGLATQETLQELDQALARYRLRNSCLPESLEDLELEDAPPFYDGWHRTLLYEKKGDDYFLGSLGADGAPGGVGLDADLCSKRDRLEKTDPTFLQFWTELPSRAVGLTCIVTGGLAFLLAWRLLRKSDLTRSRAVGLVALVVASVCFAALMSALDIPPAPSGH